MPPLESLVSPQVQSRLFGVLGDPIEHSLSPALHNAAFAALELPHVYLRFRVPPHDLPAALDEARRLGIRGLNLTIPLKETVLPLLDAISPEARAMEAVNTLTFEGRRVLGDNTDGRGFLRALAGHVRFRGADVVLIGAGGSARAVGTALVRQGCAALTIANRTPARAEALAERLAVVGTAHVRVVPLAALGRTSTVERASLVVNTTPAGVEGAVRIPIRAAATPARCVFADLVYAARPTPFLAAARRAGRATLDGRGMLLHQGALAFERWLGVPAPRAAMARALAAAGLPLTQPRAARTSRAARPVHP